MHVDLQKDLIVRHLRAVARTLVYALALYGGADLARHAFADEPVAQAYIPFVSQTSNVRQEGLEQRVRDLEDLLAGVTRSGDDLYIAGMNVYVVSGSGKTDAVPNGKGNLIVGYNEARGGRDLDGSPFDRRSGSHNLIVGKQANYTGFGGIVGGLKNEIGAEYTMVIGGSENRAENSLSAVFGGSQNETLADIATAVGGWQNKPGALFSTITGGKQNISYGEGSSISGGSDNRTGKEAENASISGGSRNEVDAERSAISGGDRVVIEAGHSGSWAAGELRSP
jgi:hypothetical protein